MSPVPARLGLLGALALAGCASAPRSGAPTRYVASTPCAALPAALTARSLAPGPKAEFLELAVDATTPCLDAAPAGARPALLFDLADLPIPAEISLHSLAQRNVTFAPAAVLLDRDFATIAHYPFERFAKRGTDYTLSVFANDRAQPPRYLLIIPDDAWLGKDNLTVAGQRDTLVWSTGVVTGVYADGHETQTTSMFSDVGRLRVAAKPYAPIAPAR